MKLTKITVLVSITLCVLSSSAFASAPLAQKTAELEPWQKAIIQSAYADYENDSPRMHIPERLEQLENADPMTVSSNKDNAYHFTFQNIDGIEFDEAKFDSLGTTFALSLRGGLTYLTVGSMTVTTTTDRVKITAPFEITFSINAEAQITHDVSLFVSIERAIGNGTRTKYFSVGVGYNLYNPLGNYFMMEEEKAAIVLGLVHGSLDITKTSYPGSYDGSIGFYGSMEYAGKISRHWEISWALGFRFIQYDYITPSGVTIVSTDEKIGGISIFSNAGFGFRF